MSSDWRPANDSLFEIDDATGELRGAALVWAALEKVGIRLGEGVITSKDPGMQEARDLLKLDPRLEDVEQWLLPVVLRPTTAQLLVVYSKLGPGAKVPLHSHPHGHYRFVAGGSVKTGDVTLVQGDWMIVPGNVQYALEAGPDGCIFFYPHPGQASPQPQPGG